MGCNCDLDNWIPEKNTGHSWVCRIHKEAIRVQEQEAIDRKRIEKIRNWIKKGTLDCVWQAWLRDEGCSENQILTYLKRIES